MDPRLINLKLKNGKIKSRAKYYESYISPNKIRVSCCRINLRRGLKYTKNGTFMFLKHTIFATHVWPNNNVYSWIGNYLLLCHYTSSKSEKLLH